MARVLVIDNNSILGLLANAALVNAFPFLEHAKKQATSSTKSGGCGCSGANSPDFNTVKTTIASLPPPAQIQFKQILGVDTVSIIYRVGSQTQSVIF